MCFAKTLSDLTKRRCGNDRASKLTNTNTLCNVKKSLYHTISKNLTEDLQGGVYEEFLHPSFKQIAVFLSDEIAF